MALGIWARTTSVFTSMRRGKAKDPAEYIHVRMKQLYEEAYKCHDAHDKQWYNRCAEELHWVLKLMEKDNGTS